jgi:endonuclease-3 related protein
VGAILTQSAAWTNVEKAIASLKAAGALSPRALHRMPEAEIAALIRPTGYFNAKARKLKAFVELVHGGFDGHLHCLLREPAERLRPRLLATHGIGPETADCIVLYAAGYPSFVIDAYTRRVFGRVLGADGVPASDTYDGWQRMFGEALRPEAAVFNEYHALIVRAGKDVCLKPAPRCDECPLRPVCAYASARPG